jgi:hypothetical protein
MTDPDNMTEEEFEAWERAQPHKWYVFSATVRVYALDEEDARRTIEGASVDLDTGAANVDREFGADWGPYVAIGPLMSAYPQARPA